MRISSGPGSIEALTNFDIAGIARSIGDAGPAPANIVGQTVLYWLSLIRTPINSLMVFDTNNQNLDFTAGDVALPNLATLTANLAVTANCTKARVAWAISSTGAGTVFSEHQGGVAMPRCTESAVVGGTDICGFFYSASQDAMNHVVEYDNTSGGAVAVTLNMRVT